MKKTLSSLAVLVSLALAGCGNQAEQKDCPILDITGGKVQGVAAENEGVYVYRGIPYAAPPLGDLRWKAPQPVQPWEGVFKADKFGHPGYQSTHYPGGYFTEWGYGDEAPYSEDCLYLNVWTKAPGEIDKKLPVALWIHGGGYREGWGSEPEFDGQEWASKDVVLVSINYRLGVFGFLTHPELNAENPNGVSGNYGILDQIESLKWIKENIKQFGGDPDNVTIFGQSAGGGSVRTICESPLARGFFHKAVIMSAGGLNTATNTNPGPAVNGLEASANANKEYLDWAGIDNLEKMRRTSTEVMHTVGTIYDQVKGDNNPRAFRFRYAPIVDGYCSLETFDAAALDGTLADVPYMMGYTLNDLGNMGEGIGLFAQNREEKGNKCWTYQFARPLPTDGRENVLKGAFHSSDLWFVFKSLKHCWRPWTQGDWDLAEKMITYWTNFAKYSDPNGPEGGEWTPCTKENPNFMVFKLDENDAESSAMMAPLQGESQAWANAGK